MIVGSLFSGCGGTALGFQRAGYEHAWFVENNDYAAATIRKNFPGATVYGDIKEVDFTTVRGVDVLEGGFPCQDISNAGRRAGIEGSRSSLWKHFARAISELRPRFVCIENVAALTRRGLDVVLIDLAALGYAAEWHCVSASAVGAPHRRDRIFILAYSDCVGQLHGQTTELSAKPVEPSQFKSGGSGSASLTPGWWSVEPDIRRVAHGVPDRVDRIKCLGNAVVPQNAEVIARAIKEISRGVNYLE